jgi:hypothetical protein
MQKTSQHLPPGNTLSQNGFTGFAEDDVFTKTAPLRVPGISKTDVFLHRMGERIFNASSI